uniref:Vg8 n=1 Tax=Tetrastichus brontispae TaxID=2033808 RepID=A0A650FL11_9HYME|nr:Vg8 [Tetrastichus brontispae]
MRKSHLDMVNQGEEHHQLFNKALAYLKQLGPADFPILEEKAMRGISARKLRNIFISMLPYIGTTHSLNFTLDIISRKIISDSLAVKVLATLPIYTLQTIPSLKTFKAFVFENNGESETKLSPQVYQSAVVSFSHLLSGGCSRLAVLGFSDEVAWYYLPFIMKAYEGANTTSSKLAFLSAIGNIRSKSTVKYVTPILFRRSDDIKDQDRLRLAAINILSELINVESDVYPQFAFNLTKILMDKTESRSIQLAAYDALISKSNYAVDKFVELSTILFDDKDLYNYHLSTIEELRQVGLLHRHAKFRMNPSNTPVSPSLSKTVILKMDKILKPELLTSMLKIQPIPRTYLKLSFISGEQLTHSDWRIPSVAKLEILERKDERIIVIKAVYFHTNYNGKDIVDGVFFDLWTVFNQNSRPYYVDTIELKNTPNLLELSDMILQKIRENVNFMYQELTKFSLKTGFGIEAVFEHKYPSLIFMVMDYNWNVEDNNLEAKIDFSFKASSNGYSGVSVYNPLTSLTHSVRITKKLDGALSFRLIVKYDFSKHQFNLSLPLNFDDSEGKASGFAVYSSTNIGITDANGEITCQNCGFRIASKNIPPASSVTLRNGDDNGLLLCETAYNFDPKGSLNSQNFLGNSDDGEELHFYMNQLPYVINTCGYIITMSHSNSSKPSSQIEFLVGVNDEIWKSLENPWYFLPGYKLNLDSSIGIRQITSNKVDYLMKLNVNMSSSQGYFSNLLQFKFVLAKKYDYRGDFILCFDGKADFPEIYDNHLPTEVTQSTLKAFSRFKVGQSREDSCSAIDFAIDFNLIGGVSEMHRDALENYAAQSLCTLQKDKWRREGIMNPLTEACLREMIANTTLRHYKLDLTSDKFSDFSLLQALLVMRSAQDKLKEMVANSHNADVEIKMTSPVSEIRTRKQMSFAADYPVPDIYKNLPNIYFPQDFVLAFVDKKINVINVYPNIMVFNNAEKPFEALDDWKEIYTGVEKTPCRIYAKVMEHKISLKIVYEGYELILKPKLVESKNETYAPQVFYNQQTFSDFHQRLHLFSSEEILFSLSRVDDYIVVRSDQIPATIYYTTSSIDIFRRT